MDQIADGLFTAVRAILAGATDADLREWTKGRLAAIVEAKAAGDVERVDFIIADLPMTLEVARIRAIGIAWEQATPIVQGIFRGVLRAVGWLGAAA